MEDISKQRKAVVLDSGLFSKDFYLIEQRCQRLLDLGDECVRIVIAVGSHCLLEGLFGLL